MTLPRASTLLKIAVPAVLIFLIIRAADTGRIVREMGNIPPSVYLAGFALLASGIALQALRWRILLRDADIPYRECYAFIGMGSALAMVSPSSLIADGAVGYWLGKRQRNVARALATLAASRVLGVVAGVILLLAAAPGHGWVFEKIRLKAPGPQIVLPILAVLALGAAWLAHRFRDRISQAIDHALPSLRRPGEISAALGLGIGVHLCHFTAHWLAYRAMGAPIAFADIAFFTPLITLLGMVPISIGGLGVREGLGIFFYTLLPGVGKEAVLAQAGWWYLVLAGTAIVNLGFAAWVLGRSGFKPAEGMAA